MSLRGQQAQEYPKNLLYNTSTMEDVLIWKKKPDAPITVSRARKIPENFSSVVHYNNQEIFLERNRMPTYDRTIERLNQKSLETSSI